MDTLFDAEWRARFEDFWAAYPQGGLRFDRDKALALFLEICRGDRPAVTATPECMIAAAQRYADMLADPMRRHGAVMPPAHWLAQACWQHELSDFEAFWSWFPSGRKRQKGKARELFLKICRERLASAEDLVDGAKRYAESMGPNHPYVQMPTTWLRGGCWEDEGEQATLSAWQRLQDRSWAKD